MTDDLIRAAIRDAEAKQAELRRKLLRQKKPPEPLASPKRDESGGTTISGL